MTLLPAPAKVLDGRENGLTESGKVVVVPEALIQLDNYFNGWQLQDLLDYRIQPTSSIRSDKKQMTQDPLHNLDRRETLAGVIIPGIRSEANRKRSEVIQ